MAGSEPTMSAMKLSQILQARLAKSAAVLCYPIEIITNNNIKSYTWL